MFEQVIDKIISLIPLEIGDTLGKLGDEDDADWLLMLDPDLSFDPVDVAIEMNRSFLPLIKLSFKKYKGRKGIVVLMTTLELHVFERHRISRKITKVVPITIKGRQYGVVLFERFVDFKSKEETRT